MFSSSSGKSLVALSLCCLGCVGPTTTDFCTNSSTQPPSSEPVLSLERFMTLESEAQAPQFFSRLRDEIIAKGSCDVLGSFISGQENQQRLCWLHSGLNTALGF